LARKMASKDTVVATVAKVFADANARRTTDWWDYDHFSPDWSLETQERYEIIKKVGRGKYSEVFEAVDTARDSTVIIKVLKPVRQRKIRREIKILENLAGGPNVVKLLGIVREPVTRTPSIIFERINSIQTRTILAMITDHDSRFYLVQILRGLEYCHSVGIMHRDIKPQNLVIDHKNKILRIIDWGLAEFYHPRQDYNSRVGSRHFKAPELLVEYPFYDYSLDLWAVGCMMAGMIFREDVFFRGANNHDQLLKITKVLGSDKLQAYMQKYNITIDQRLHKTCEGHPERSWNEFVSNNNKELATSESIDLLSQMLQYDHMARPTAREALEHPYLKAVYDSSLVTQNSSE